MVIVKWLWQALQEYTKAPEAMDHRLLRRMVEYLQDGIACRETQLEARAEDMHDLVTKQVEMALIRYNPQITECGSSPIGGQGGRRARRNWRKERKKSGGSA